ncbi:MAG TPA: YebC/PmpR family DNA-binding transcriptional regulator [Bacillota bacterium]|jgi:YebC/PmpR family DNA-binding regulatory protein|nr:YebC/PmpR family DNA-binding transcriptional regulator [Bacillota bacterium]HOL10643.1 YebC/PmpR family DNA-binding transcriptional regulator [Bacillota bacterium]HPO98422.1 YebC/PmpR family DNA-binding transcriptional regulator [Bacillota bacterium]
MSGHSKWSTIKRKKEKTDQQRASIFTKVTREIIVAAKAGGGDPDNNFRLRMAILKAKEVNMPNDNIQRAIKRGTGQSESDNYEETFYEGYGPAGVAVLVQVLTDNRNRTASEMRYIFSRNNGNLGEAGCVAWMFDTKGLITVENESTNRTEEEMFELAIEAGAEDLQNNSEFYEIYTAATDLDAVRQLIEQNGIAIKSAELTKVPQNTIEVSGEQAQQVIKLIEALEDNDDVQNVYSNADIPDEELE